jgi:hypothetical protein
MRNEESPRWGCSGKRDEGEKGKVDTKEVLEELHSEVSMKGGNHRPMFGE